MEAEYETAPVLSIGTMTFDHGWPWIVLDLGHRTSASDISNIVRHNGGQIENHQWAFDWHHDLLTLDDLEQS